MTYDNWKTREPQDSREYEDQPNDRLACGCYGTCDPFAHDTAWNWTGECDALYPQRIFMEPYFLDETFCGWELYFEDDPECRQCLKKFSSLEEARDWVEEDNQRPNSFFA